MKENHDDGYYLLIVGALLPPPSSSITPFTGTAYRVKYFKPIPKEINQDASTVWT